MYTYGFQSLSTNINGVLTDIYIYVYMHVCVYSMYAHLIHTYTNTYLNVHAYTRAQTDH